ncbi:Apc15p protein-domain-containing protein [Aspergillus avenaceus]|uniref:Apc15p protein-domain-containing protein n=1 Tax=Aspergillus avenaceus TaxID=36643 RepID=A0A5N6TH51_ASPAV|nr:Apc15p protein-domain-containing protein [Aspergillus avenaceus]
MMLSLPLLTPRDSHELWFGSSQLYRSSAQHSLSHNEPQGDLHRNGSNTSNGRVFLAPTTSGSTLSSLLLEERALRARKNNIASFGYSWIKPAGCAKTMLGMKEEEAEREEALAAAAAEMAATAAAAEAGGDGTDGFGTQHDEVQDDTGMERDLDDDIPDADAEGLVEEGEEGLEDEGAADEEGYMERDLDDDIPEAYPDEYDDDDRVVDSGEENEEYFDNQPDLDDEIPSASEIDDELEGISEGDMGRDLDDDVPEAAEDRSEQEDEWQHTDTDAEFDDEDDVSFSHDPFTQSLRASVTSSRGLPPAPVRPRETEAQRRFLQRWSGGGDVFDTSSMLVDEDDLRASVTSQGSRRSFLSRFPRRRTGGSRDNIN